MKNFAVLKLHISGLAFALALTGCSAGTSEDSENPASDRYESVNESDQIIGSGRGSADGEVETTIPAQKSPDAGDNTPAPVEPPAMTPAPDDPKPVEPKPDIPPVVVVPTPTPVPDPKPEPEPEPIPEPMGILKNGNYVIKSVLSGKCLQPAGKSRSAGVDIFQETCNGGVEQKFQLRFVDGKYYQITSLHSSYSLAVGGGQAINMAHIIQGTYTHSANQQFLIERVSSGIYTVKSRPNSALCMDVSYASMENGAFIQLWRECHLPNQQWIFQSTN